MTWSEIREWQKKFIDTLYSKFPDGQEWFRGAGISFDIGENAYKLVLNIATEAHMPLANSVIMDIRYPGKYEIRLLPGIPEAFKAVT